MDSKNTKLNQDNETKAEKFIRLGEYRINKAMEAIIRLENLSNRSSYEYTERQVEDMFSILETRLLEVKSKFVAKKSETVCFTFDRKEE